MTTQTKSRGFTIVELLIVIIVIAILAAITIVAYNGITNKANASAGKQNATSVNRVASAYAADDNLGNGSFPTIEQLTAATLTTKVPAGVTVQAGLVTEANKNGKTITYILKSDGSGACIGSWDSSISPAAIVWTSAGNATYSSGTCS